MPQFAVELHPRAADEAKAAERWYRERNEIASDRVQRELDLASDLISERPNTGSPYLGNTRRVLLRPLSLFRRVSRARRQRSDRRCCACATAAGILASALTGGSRGSKS
jgi:hypothetical protein